MIIKRILAFVNKEAKSLFIHSILCYSTVSFTLGQQNTLRFELFVGEAIQQYEVISEYPEVTYPRFVEANYRFDMSYWFQNQLGVGVGVERQVYRLLYEDHDPRYQVFTSYGRLSTVVLPISFFYRQQILKISPKQSLNLILTPAISLGFNSRAIQNEPTYRGQNRPSPNSSANNFYADYEYGFNHTALFSTLDIGARLEYQINRVGVGLTILYYKGLGKIGSMKVSYYTEGNPVRSVEVNNLGSQLSYGVYFSYDLFLKKRASKSK